MSGLRRWLSTGLIVLFAATITAAQTQDQVRQQAESRLRQMSPSEIEQALKQYGLTLDEATKRAQSMGISLQDYLTRPSTTAPGEKTHRGPVRRSATELATDLHAPRSRSIAPSQPFERERSFVDTLTFPASKAARGIDSTMQPFGYEVFRFPATTFLPSLSVATPPSYVLGAGDEIVISVWGETYLTHRLQVNREGNVFIPDVGPVTAIGLTMQQFREHVQRRMSAVYSGLAGTRGRSTLDVSLEQTEDDPGVRPRRSKQTRRVCTLLHVHRPACSLSRGRADRRWLPPRCAGAPPRRDRPLPWISMRSCSEGTASTDEPLQDGDIVFVKPAGQPRGCRRVRSSVRRSMN